MKVFRLFDVQGEGFISLDNLKQIARELGEIMTEASALMLFCILLFRAFPTLSQPFVLVSRVLPSLL